MAEQTKFNYAEYLANLLIIQYHDKPKAKSTIMALGSQFPIDLMFAVRDGFDLNTATGKQLDILGKYLMCDRWYDKEGVYSKLSDDDYRLLLKLKAIANTTNSSHKSIDESLYKFFGNKVRASSVGDMEMTYFVPRNSSAIIEAAIQKEVLPRPMGVEVKYIIEYEDKFFGFCTYQDQDTTYRTGFRTYEDPDKAGEMFDYNKTIDF